MPYTVRTTRQFDKSFEKMKKRGFPIEAFQTVIKELLSEGKLSAQFRPHKLSGKYKGYWECHIKPDWLLVWDQNDMELTLLLVDTGSHSDLF